MVGSTSTEFVEHDCLLSNTCTVDIDPLDNAEKMSSVSPSPRSGITTSAHASSSPLTSTFRPRFNSWLLRYIVAFSTLVLFLGWVILRGFSISPHFSRPFPSKTKLAAIRYDRPKDTKIVGLVFFGRRDRAAILDCYLKTNLVSSGGWLDEVIWGVNTDNTDDLAYLEKILPSSPAYRKVELQERSYFGLWNESIEAGNIYVKLDDDVVYMDEDAIPLVVHTLVNNTNSIVVSANMINSPELNWLHYRSDAILPYLPDFGVPALSDLSTSEKSVWRSSELPEWSEPDDFSPPTNSGAWNDYLQKMLQQRSAQAALGPAGLPHHRWLPLKGHGDISKTPIARTENGAFGGGWWSWAIAAQQHYSLLDNLEYDRKYVYYLNHGLSSSSDAIWDHTGDRISINFLAVRGETILDNLDRMVQNGDDEGYLSKELPDQLNKRGWPISALECQ